MLDRTRLPAAWRRLSQARRRDAARTRNVRAAASAQPLDPIASAKLAGLRYVNDQTMPGIRRVGSRRNFRYVAPPGGRLTADDRRRIRSLAIPPAWTDVWICPNPLGHLQATGRDARGRKQYRYHPQWRTVRDEAKYGRLLAFARALPAIRRRTSHDLSSPGLPREKVLAAVVQLLEKTLIRIGNDEYARENGSFGLTTMRDQHARINGGTVRFEFRGKSGIRHAVDLHDRRLARIVKACRDIPGYELLQYVDHGGRRQAIDSSDVNAYLREIANEEFTAKDFRTWAGTVLAAQALAALGGCRTQAEARRNVVKAIDSVARRLGNTKAVCRTCYIHPAVLSAYMDGRRMDARLSGAATTRARGAAAPARRGSSEALHGLSAEERAVVALLRRRSVA